MAGAGDAGSVSRGRRAWLLVMAGAWAALGIVHLTEDRALLGLGELVLAALSLAAALSPRAAAVLDTPVWRRRRAGDTDAPRHAR